MSIDTLYQHGPEVGPGHFDGWGALLVCANKIGKVVHPKPDAVCLFEVGDDFLSLDFPLAAEELVFVFDTEQLCYFSEVDLLKINLATR